MTSKILVVGGAGYIGAHVVRALLERGHEVDVLDNLSAGEERSCPGARITLCDYRRTITIEDRYEGAVILAARVLTGESFEDPLGYYETNVAGLIGCLSALRGKVGRIVFASSCAAAQPLSPYAASKAMGERILADAAERYGFSTCILRLFNVVGGREDVWLPQRPASYLLRAAARVALGLSECVTINGRDYDTPNKTCIRDYVHVSDVAEAICAALESEEAGFDVGSGNGVSNLEAVSAMQVASGQIIPVRFGPRRAGDPDVLVAHGEHLRPHDIRSLCASELETEARRGL